MFEKVKGMLSTEMIYIKLTNSHMQVRLFNQFRFTGEWHCLGSTI